MPEQITAVFICGPGSEEYIGFAIQTLLRTANHPDRFDFLIGYNKPLQNPDYFHQEIPIVNRITLYSVVNHLQEASSSHMQSLTEALNYLYTKNQQQQAQKQIKKVLICDADIAFLYHGWDTMMENLLSSTNIMVGTAYPNKADKKYQNFPTLYVALIDFPRFMDLKIDLMPYVDNKKTNHVKRIRVTTPSESTYFGVKIGSTIKYDSGYQIPIRIKDAKLTGTSFENREVASHLSTTKNKKYGIFTQTPPQASLSLGIKSPTTPYIFYEIYYQNHLLFTHLGNSRNKEFKSHPEALYWRKICEYYIKTSVS